MAERVKYSMQELTDRLFPIYWYRKHLDFAVRDILGLDLSPHHSLILRDWGRGKSINHLLSSRGLGKSVLMAIFFLVSSLLYPRLKLVVAAGTAFRGSKMVLFEIERIISNFLSNQRQTAYARHSLNDRKKPINKDPSYWSTKFANGSEIKGIPLAASSEGDSVRGIRTNHLGMDETFLIPTKLKDAALVPMMNVLYDMNKPPEEQTVKNMQIGVSTIDFSFRDFWKDGEFYKAVLFLYVLRICFKGLCGLGLI